LDFAEYFVKTKLGEFKIPPKGKEYKNPSLHVYISSWCLYVLKCLHNCFYLFFEFCILVLIFVKSYKLASPYKILLISPIKFQIVHTGPYNLHVLIRYMRTKLSLSIRLNSSFDPLCFKKLRFWPPNKIKYKTAS